MNKWIKISETREAWGNRFIYEIPESDVYVKTIEGGPFKGDKILVTDVVGRYGIITEYVKLKDKKYIVEIFDSIGD